MRKASKVARYQYSCAECGGSVTKTPVGQSEPKRKENAGLHGWKCASCKRGVKVVRKLNGS